MSDHRTAGDRIGEARARLVESGAPLGVYVGGVKRLPRAVVYLNGLPLNSFDVAVLGARRSIEAAIDFASLRIVDAVIATYDAGMLLAISTGMSLHDQARGAA